MKSGGVEFPTFCRFTTLLFLVDRGKWWMGGADAGVVRVFGYDYSEVVLRSVVCCEKHGDCLLRRCCLCAIEVYRIEAHSSDPSLSAGDATRA